MVSRIIEYCARNRLVVLLGVTLATLAAAWSISRTKIDAIPDLTDPQVIVFTEWMGRSPTLIEDQVTYPVVSALISAPKVVDVRGYSMFGMSFVYVIFDEGTDMYWARSRVNEMLGTIRARLPEGVVPTLGPDATGIGWAFQYTLVDRSGKTSIDELRTFQDFSLRYALGSVPGVAEVASVGGYQKQYQVTVDPNRLRAYGVTLEDVVRAVRESNKDVGGRVIEMSGREYYVRGRGYIQDIGALASTSVKASGPSGVPVLLHDLGTVRFGPDIRRGALDWNGEGEAVGGIVVVRYGENTLEVVERVKKRLDELRSGFPPGVTAEVAYDRTDLILRSIDTLKRALLEEMLTVAAVILIFLLHVRLALLPMLSLPIAVALAFIPMYLLDIPATIMSLGGIAIAIGATVDAEIVMIEASHKALESAPPGADRRKLLADAAREVTPAIFFSLLIIAVSFLPVFTLTGQAGRLFRPLAFTKTFVMLSAALLSITFAPALRDLLLRGKIRPESKHPISKAIIRVYKPFVFVALRWPKTTVALGLLAILSAVPLAIRLGSEFMPPLNEGDVLFMPTTFPGISIEEAKGALQRQDRALRAFPEVASVFGKVGRAETATDPAPITMVETTLRLKPVSEWRMVEQRRWYSGWAPGWLRTVLRPIWPDRRRITSEELTAEMNRATQFPGWTNAYTMPIRARIDMLTTGVRTPVGVKVMGSDLAEIEKMGVALERLLAPVAGTRSVYYERNTGGLYLDIYPNREALARRGLTVGDLQRTIEAAIGGAPVTTTVEGRARFSISVRYPQDLRSDVERLKQMLVPLPGAGGRGGGGGGGMGGSGDATPVRIPELMLAQGMGGASAPPGRPSGGPRGAISDAPTLDWSQSLPRVQDLPLGARGQPTGATPGSAGFVPLGQVADIRIVGGPPMLRDEGGLLVGYVYVDVDPSVDIGGYVDSQARRGRGDGERKVRGPAGLLPQVDGPVRAAREDERPAAAGHPAHPGHHRRSPALALQERDRGAHRAPLHPVRAGGERVAPVAPRLPALHRGLGGTHRPRRPGRADRHRHDRLHRHRLRAAAQGGEDPRPRRHHLGPHGGDGDAGAPQAHDRGHHAGGAPAAALGHRLRGRRHEADRGPDGGRPHHLGVPHARDHPGGLHLLAAGAAALGAARAARPGQAPPAADPHRGAAARLARPAGRRRGGHLHRVAADAARVDARRPGRRHPGRAGALLPGAAGGAPAGLAGQGREGGLIFAQRLASAGILG